MPESADGERHAKDEKLANSKNKFGYVYMLTPTGMAEKAAIAQGFLQRTMDEYETLKAEIKALRSEVEKPCMKEFKKHDRRHPSHSLWWVRHAFVATVPLGCPEAVSVQAIVDALAEPPIPRRVGRAVLRFAR